MLTAISPEKVGFSAKRLDRIAPVMQRYIDTTQTGGILTLVERKGEIVHLSKCGYLDLAEKKPLEQNHIFRIYSMSKPIISLGLMMLFEQAKFHLSDPVEKYIPEFKNLQVLGPDGKYVTPNPPMTIRHLLTHTSGLTYGAFGETTVDKRYQAANLFEKNQTLAEMVQKIAGLPLVKHPGEQWIYSVSTDVVGRLIEVISGMTLGDYLEEQIFAPLGMVDTGFSVPDEKLQRLTTCYAETEQEQLAVYDSRDGSIFQDVKLHSGGGGLVSTLADYLQFARLMRNQGALNGVRLVGRKTIELMTANHIAPHLFPLAVTDPFPGFGFGLGVSVVMDVPMTQELGSVGSFGWGGLASTTFWVDPQEELIAILMTQYIPLNPFPLQADFKTLVYQALIN